MIDGVIFDKDGTLFDFRHTWGPWVRRVLAELAGNPERAAAMAQVLGYDPETNIFAPDSIVIAGTVRDSARLLQSFLPDMPITELTARLNHMAMDVSLAETVPLRALLMDLRARGLRIGLATNDSEAPARTHLADAGIGDLFDFIAGFDSGYGGKPEPGMLLEFLRRFDLEPRRVAMVGDSTHDLHAGQAAGMRRVAVLTGIAGADELGPHADVVLPDISGIPGWIDGLSLA